MEGVVIGVVHENGAVTEEDVVTAGRGAGRPFAGAGLIHQVVAGVGVVPHHGVGVSADHPVAHLLTGLGVVLSVGVAAAVPPEEGTIGTKATGTVVTIAVAIVACTAVVMGLDSVSTAPPLTRMTTVVSMVQQVEAMIHMDLLHPTVALVVTLSLTTARTAVAEVQDLMALLVVSGSVCSVDDPHGNWKNTQNHCYWHLLRTFLYPGGDFGPPPGPWGGGGGGGGGRRGGRGMRRDDGPPGVSLLVRNVSPDITPDDLQMAFGRIGEVRDVYIPRDFHSQQPKGFAFIEYATPDQAREARDEMDKFLMKGRELEVVFAQEKRKTPNEMRGRVVDGGSVQGREGRGRGGSFERSSSFERHKRREREQRDYHGRPDENGNRGGENGGGGGGQPTSDSYRPQP
uniref:RRM domain-containing protein n=1 Tax=Ditylum brightwellii TaxID=49249 RepID=A0A6V2AFZ1_9STRA